MCDKLVSVVVPVFNAEKFLPQAIKCLIKQTYQTVEYIFVNDGSTDRTFSILKEYSQRDNRIHVISQSNEGAGVARNFGLRVARGEYIIFLDADDYFDITLIEKLVSCAELNNSDITICKAWAINNNKKILDMNFNSSLFKIYHNKSFSPLDVKEQLFNSFLVEPWNKMYKRSLLVKNNIVFQKLRKTNDLFFTSVSLMAAGRISIVDEKLVYYRLNNRYKVISTFEEKLLDHYRALINIKKHMRYYDQHGMFIDSFNKMALKIVSYNLTLKYTPNIRKRLVDFYIDEGFKCLGLESDKYYNSLSILEKTQLYLLKHRYPKAIQHMGYKLLKAEEYIRNNGLKSVFFRIIH